MHDLYTILKWNEEHIYREVMELQKAIAAYRKCLAASDHPLKAEKLKQLATMLTRLV